MAHALAAHPAPQRRTVSVAVAVAAILAGLVAAAIAAAPPGWAGALSLLWLMLAVATWRWPVVGLVAVALAVPFEQRWSLPTVAGDLTAMKYTVWALVAGAAPVLLRRRQVFLDRVAVAHLAMLAALVASFAAGGVRVGTWWDTIHAWLLAWLVYVVARSLRLGRRKRDILVAALAAGIFVNLAKAIWQVATVSGPESFVVGGFMRAFGTFYHPNTLAAYLAFVLPVLIAMSLSHETRVLWMARAGAVAGLVALLLTQSRGGMLSLGAAMVVLVLLMPRAIQRWLVVGVAGVALLVLASGAIDRVPVVDRFTNIAVGGEAMQVTRATWGQQEREAHGGAAWSRLWSDPLFGVGAGEFNDNYREQTPEWRYRVGRGHAHNGYLQLGAEAGVPGMAAFTLWVGTILVALSRRVLGAIGTEYWLAAGALGASVAWAVDNVFEYQDVPSIPIMFALVVALGLSGAAGNGRAFSRGDATGDVR
jgi:hypothetical protein